MTQHTPGPWRVYDNTDSRYYPHRVQPDGAPYYDHIANVRGPNADADARLIAAAPDLLAALRIAETLIAADIVRDDAGCLDKVRAAIAKATGDAL